MRTMLLIEWGEFGILELLGRVNVLMLKNFSVLRGKIENWTLLKDLGKFDGISLWSVGIIILFEIIEIVDLIIVFEMKMLNFVP